MSENFRDYLIALADDPALLARYNADPKDTLRDAAISNEERKALLSGDAAQINALLVGQDVPERVKSLIAKL